MNAHEHRLPALSPVSLDTLSSCSFRKVNSQENLDSVYQ